MTLTRRTPLSLLVTLAVLASLPAAGTGRGHVDRDLGRVERFLELHGESPRIGRIADVMLEYLWKMHGRELAVECVQVRSPAIDGSVTAMTSVTVRGLKSRPGPDGKLRVQSVALVYAGGELRASREDSLRDPGPWQHRPRFMADRRPRLGIGDLVRRVEDGGRRLVRLDLLNYTRLSPSRPDLSWVAHYRARRYRFFTFDEIAVTPDGPGGIRFH